MELLRMIRRERLLLPALLVLLTGCYSYVPASLETVSPGDQVRVRISAVAADRLEPVRFTTAREMDGAIVRFDDDQLYFDAIIRTVDATGITAMFTQRLNLATTEVQDVQHRRLDVLKTGAAVSGGAFLLGGAAYAVSRGLLRGRTGEYEPIEMHSPFRLRWSIPF
jgi:hypothetical protein